MPRKKAKIDYVLKPFRSFLNVEASSGILLLIATFIALFWANSPWKHSYFELWETKVSLGFGTALMSKTLHHWINDGLMAIFFFVIGLEIKREFIAGHLASPKKAALPIAGALGGMIVPALIYAFFNINQIKIPIAT